MIAEYSKKHQCMLSAGLLLLILLLLGSVILVPWWGKMSFYEEETLEQTVRLQKFKALNNSRKALEAQLRNVRQQAARSSLYINATTPALAAAELQKRVKQTVETQGGKLVSTQNIAKGQATDSNEIVIRVRMSGGVDVLTKVLHKLEGEEPLLFVENLSIRSHKRVRGRRRNRTTQYRLDIHFDLIGYLRGGAV